jgi:hypothetical protein
MLRFKLTGYSNFMWLKSICHPCRGFCYIPCPYSHRSPSLRSEQARRATLFRSPGGTPGNEELVHYSNNDARVEEFKNVTFRFDGRVHALIGCGVMRRKLFTTYSVAGRL